MRLTRLFRKLSTGQIAMRVPYVDDRGRIHVGTIEITITEQDKLGGWLASGATGSFCGTAHLRKRG